MEKQDVDHLSVKILSSQTELRAKPLSQISEFNITRNVALETLFFAKESFSTVWGFSYIFSYQIFVSLLFCLVTTLLEIFASLKKNYFNYRRCEIPQRFFIKRKRLQLRRSRSVVVISLLIIILFCINTSNDYSSPNYNTLESRGTNLTIPTEVVNNLSSIFVNSKGKTLRPKYLLLFLLCGDVNLNPGPTSKTPCGQCFRTICKNYRFVKCAKCDLSFHIKCAEVTPVMYNRLQIDKSISFTCKPCIDSTLPFADFEDFNENFDICDNDFVIPGNYEAINLDTNNGLNIKRTLL